MIGYLPIIIAGSESRRLVLTKEKMGVLDFVRSHRRVAMRGGAGTGKTVLALEKARRLANDGFQTLLTCDNRQLADHLARLCAGTANLDVMSFHQLCHRRVERANRESGRDLLAEAKITYPGKDLYDVQFPNALTYSLEILPTGYEAIICDEGHDNAMAESFFATLECELLSPIPPVWKEMAAKFHAMGDTVIGSDRCDRVIEFVTSLDAAESVRPLLELVRR